MGIEIGILGKYKRTKHCDNVGVKDYMIYEAEAGNLILLNWVPAFICFQLNNTAYCRKVVAGNLLKVREGCLSWRKRVIEEFNH